MVKQQEDQLDRERIARSLHLESGLLSRVEAGLRAAGVNAHVPIQQIFFDRCASDSEAEAMKDYLLEVGREHLASVRFLGDSHASSYFLRNPYTLQPLWPDAVEAKRHAAEPILARVIQLSESNPREHAQLLERARRDSSEICAAQGQHLLEDAPVGLSFDTPTGRSRTLHWAFQNGLDGIDGLAVSEGPVRDLKPIVSLQLSVEWVLVVFLQRASGFTVGEGSTLLDLQTAVVPRSLLDRSKDRLPIPHGIHRLYFRECVHGLRGAYLSTEDLGFALAAVHSHCVLLRLMLPMLREALARLSRPS
jgi:hypothetical protein